MTEVTMILCLIGLIGIGIGMQIPNWLYNFHLWVEKQKVLNIITPKKTDESLLCDGPHEWTETKVINPEGVEESSQFCTKCGLVSGYDQMITQEYIAEILEKRRLTEEETLNKKEFLAREEQMIREFFSEELQKDLSIDKLLRLYHAGQTAGGRYVAFHLEKAEKQLEDTV